MAPMSPSHGRMIQKHGQGCDLGGPWGTEPSCQAVSAHWCTLSGFLSTSITIPQIPVTWVIATVPNLDAGVHHCCSLAKSCLILCSLMD